MVWKLEDQPTTAPAPAPGGWQLEGVGPTVEAAAALNSTTTSTPTKKLSAIEALTAGTKQALSGYGAVIKNPIAVVESGAQILSDAPSFLGGVVGAIQDGVQAILAGNDMEDIYSHMEYGFQREYGKMSGILKPYHPKHNPEGAEAVTNTVMAPALIVKQVATDLANMESLQGYPDVRAALNLIGDVGGIALQGKAHSFMKVAKEGKIAPDFDAYKETVTAEKLSRESGKLNLERTNPAPLNRLSNVEKSMIADRENALGDVPVKSAEESARVFEAAPREATMTPAEKSAWVFEDELAPNRTMEGKVELASRLNAQQFADDPGYKSMLERGTRDAELKRQADMVGEQSGPNTPRSQLPTERSPKFVDDGGNPISTGDPAMDSLHWLLTDNGFEYTSSQLRSGNTPDYVRSMETALDKLPRHEGQVFRGIELDSPQDVGKFISDVMESRVVSDPSVVFGSKNLGTAKDYTNQRTGHGVILDIESSTGRDISSLAESNINRMNPVVFKPGTQFEVVGDSVNTVKGPDGIIPVVKLREIPPGGGKVRSVSDIFRDINAAIGNRGSIGGGTFTPEQAAAHARLKSDMDVIRRNAARTGKEVGQYLLDLGTDPAVVQALVSSSTRLKSGAPLVSPQQAADQHNVKFNGMWEFPPEMNKEPIFTWTDKRTGGTFTSKTIDDLPSALVDHLEKFHVTDDPRIAAVRMKSVADEVAKAEAMLRESAPTGAGTTGAMPNTTVTARRPPTTPPSPPPRPPLEDVIAGMESSTPGDTFMHKLTRTKEGTSEALNSPQVVFARDKSGVGNQIYTELDRADQRGNSFMYEQGTEFDRASRLIKQGSESDLRVGAALDGKLDPKKLNQPERTLYDFLRTKFDFLLNRYVKSAVSSDAMYKEIVRRANRGERKGERKPIDQQWYNSLSTSDRAAFDLMERRVTDYLPHIFDRDTLRLEFADEIDRIKRRLSTAVDKGAQTFHKNRLRQLEAAVTKMDGGGLVTYDQLPTSIRNRFFEPRKGKQGYNLSATRAYAAYLNGIKRKIYDEPAVRRVAELHKSLDPSLREYNKWYVKRYLGWDRHKLDDIAGAISSFQWMRTLGLNPRSPIVNLTQRINTTAEVGLRHSIIGQKQAFTSEGTALFDKTGMAKEVPQVLMEGKAPPGMEKVRAIMGWMFNKVEIGNRKHAFLSGRAKALSEGKSEADAFQAGIDTAHKTQFRYGRVGMPKALSHPLGRIGLQFWSYPIKQVELLVDWGKNDPKKLITYIAMAEGGKETLKELFNVDLSNALGFGINFGQALDAIRSVSDADWRGFFRHMKLATSSGGGLLPSGPGPTVSGLMRIIDNAKEGRGMEALGKELTPVVVERTRQAYKAVTNEHDGAYPIYNRNNELMYYLTGKQLLMRSVGPRPATESKQYTNWMEDDLLSKERVAILRDITRAIVDGDNKTANKLIGQYGIVPSEEAVANEVMRRELPSETRRELRKSNKQREYEISREGSDEE